MPTAPNSAMMTKDQFAARWTDAEARAKSFLWTIHGSGMMAAGATLAAMVAFLVGAPYLDSLNDVPAFRSQLRMIAGGIAAAAAAVIAVLVVAGKQYWAALTSLGMQCPQCSHFLTRHTGVPIKGGSLCDKCEWDKCRTTPQTGLCPKCGYKVFEA